MRRLPIVILLLVLVTSCGRGRVASGSTTTTSSSSTAVTTPVPSTTPAPVATSPTTTAAPPVSQATTTAAPTTTKAPPPLPKVGTTPTGVVVLVTGRSAAGVTVTSPCGRPATVPSVFPVGPVKVVLDPGHGGGESGALGPNGLKESTLNLAVAEQAQAALRSDGVSVALTRSADYMMTLASRGRVVQALAPKAFVSIHHNAEPDGPSDGPGTETYFQIGSTSSKRLAGLIWEEVHQALSQYPVAWQADTDAGAKYRPGSNGDYYAVLRLTKGVTSVLAELAYISDPPEADLLARPDVQRIEGAAVARGIVRYLTTSDPGSGFTTPYPHDTPAGGGGGESGCVDPRLA